jgi:hypothetical protein
MLIGMLVSAGLYSVLPDKSCFALGATAFMFSAMILILFDTLIAAIKK